MASRQTLHELPQLYSAADVATALGCSEWWVKEQARRRRIPFIKSGSGYRFTKEHVQEILNILEERPQGTSNQSPENGAARRRVRPQAGTPVVQLRARRPRRAKNVA
ncbi:DNA-binding protein [Streptomyces platensis]|uniref:DNA-binding protein n=1 Tax=Streptomyces platensis TaxID=58346 RepID=A0AAE6TNI6_STRPT|nr:helix-turn-helix domain-containing protein [Streptomyces platensis]OSY34602.1 hypothetical protein BG653_07389 [Streptomyces platensis]QEV53837.1 DNA-binding protein [Streptomyces platensis]